MKTLSYKALRLIINVSLILYVLGGTFMAIFLIGKGMDEDSTTFRVGLPDRAYYTLNQEVGVVQAKSSEIKEQVLVTNKVAIEFKTASTYIKTVFLSYGVSSFFYSLIIFLFIRAFVNSLRDQSVFTVQNVKRLRIIGILLLLAAPLNALQDYFMRSLVEDYFTHSIFNLDGGIAGRLGLWLGSSTANGTFVSSWIIAGLIIMVIAEVFKQGLQIKEEQDLTI
ncbi:hypothetical protein SanaruYs_27320 [Chryseotalea sanaruensis]|uniref:DUF2975 domain-containing protein n=1 Tax=Chryseotalea sanaruensis TaxID=2482724 RepID=A0A401UC92_9BACT|nr:DUF2975 domain-containing protein [Chryseotalea sanaruensis]GCC52495.1 hypothetical protein SanaruYs_27320 [Chryseotalea sanaruensis]